MTTSTIIWEIEIEGFTMKIARISNLTRTQYFPEVGSSSKLACCSVTGESNTVLKFQWTYSA